MGRPIVAIVGQPNVGKSTLFNRILSRKQAVVSPVAGVTRDRNYSNYSWNRRELTLIDTGGLEIGNFERNPREVYEQTRLAIMEGDVILFIVDVAQGVTGLDEEICQLLRPMAKKTILVVNKVDSSKRELAAADFYSLGMERMFTISAEHGQGVGDLLDEVNKLAPAPSEAEEDEDVSCKIAIVGRPNVGKSSLINAIIGEERLVVTPKPGTTRDSIDTYFDYQDERFILIDTAGIRKRGKVSGSPEYYSIIRSIRSINRCDVACLVIDASEGITVADAKVGSFCEEAGCGIILVFNKWDLVEKDTHTVKKFMELTERKLPFLNFAPSMFISALTKQRIFRIFPDSLKVYSEATKRIPTAALNKFLRRAVDKYAPFSTNSSSLNLLYITQIAEQPPTFTIFYNGRGVVATSYGRYLRNQMREAFGFIGNPIFLIFRKKKRNES